MCTSLYFLTISFVLHIFLFIFITYGLPFILSYNFWKIPYICNYIYIPLLSSGSPLDQLKMKLRFEKTKLSDKLSEISEDKLSAKKDLIEIDRVARLSLIIKDSDNNALRIIKAKYDTFFDEESGNDTKQGLKDIYSELHNDYLVIKKQEQDLKKKLDSVDAKLKALDSSDAQLIFVTRFFSPLLNLRSLLAYMQPYFSLLLTVFLLLCSTIFIFSDLFIDLSYYIHSVEDYIQSIIKYEIFVSLVLLLWSLSRFLNKIPKYLYIGKLLVNFVQNSHYLDTWLLLLIFIILIFNPL